MYIWISVPAIVLLLGALLLVPVRIWTTVSNAHGKWTFGVYAGFGFIRINVSEFIRKAGKKKKEEEPHDKPKKEFSLKGLEKAFEKGISALRYLKKKFTVKLFSISLRFGTGDAADTGILTGAAYTTVYGILGSIDRYFVLKKHEVRITPVFESAGIEMEFCGTFQLKLLYCLGLIQKIRKEDVK